MTDAKKHPNSLEKFLLICGIVSFFLYIGTDILLGLSWMITVFFLKLLANYQPLALQPSPSGQHDMFV